MLLFAHHNAGVTNLDFCQKWVCWSVLVCCFFDLRNELRLSAPSEHRVSVPKIFAKNLQGSVALAGAEVGRLQHPPAMASSVNEAQRMIDELLWKAAQNNVPQAGPKLGSWHWHRKTAVACSCSNEIRAWKISQVWVRRQNSAWICARVCLPHVVLLGTP